MVAKKLIQSHTRLTKFENCPRQYERHYIARERPEPGVPLRFGKAVHSAVEAVSRHHVAHGLTGPLDESITSRAWAAAFREEKLTGLAVYHEGLGLLRAFVRDEGPVNYRNIIDIEVPFTIDVHGISVRGVMDRVNRLDAETIEVVDFKTNRLLPTREELEHHLQLGIYNLAARELYPWAKHVVLTLHMLRHSTRLATMRTEDQLASVRAYILALDMEMAVATEFPARLSPNCQYCEHRGSCLEYQKAVAGNLEVVAANENELESVAREREQVAALAKIHAGRQRELDKLLAAKLNHTESLTLAGRSYRLGKVTRRSYPVEKTVEALCAATSLDEADVRRRLLRVENKALTSLLSGLKKGMSKPEHRLLRTELSTLR